jgi:hypothetical protein
MRTVLVMLGIALVLGACGAPAGPRPGPTVSPPSTTMSSTTRGPIPKVARSLALTGHLGNPCDLLANEDLVALGFAGNFVVIPPYPAEKDRTCEVGGGSSGGTLHLILSVDVSPLPEAYASTPDKYEFFRPVEILGFPAVELGSSAEHPLRCLVTVGTAEQQGFIVDHTPSSIAGTTEAGCARVVSAAEGVLKRLGA